jgi:hypothetical protein
MSSRFAMPRRTFLRGMAYGCGVALGLPILEAMVSTNGDALADGSPLPRRFGVFFWGCGNQKLLWNPRTTGTEWELTPLLAPFQGIRSKMSVVTGMVCPASGTAHHAGQAGMMSGEGVLADASDGSVYKHASVDVTVARAMRTGASSPVRLLNVGVWLGNPEKGTPGNLSFDGSAFNANETSPRDAYARLLDDFARASAASATFDPTSPVVRRAAARSRVLDVIKEDRNALMKRLGAADRVRLDGHLEGIHALQQRLLASTRPPSPRTAACNVPASTPDGRSEALVAERHRTMVEVVALTLACDMARVFTYQFSSWYSPPFTEFGSHLHTLTHEEPGHQPKVQQVLLFSMNQFAHLLQRLRDVQEGDASLLDQCAILGTSEVSDARRHAKDEMPIIVAGGAGGRLRMGEHIRSVGTSAYRVHVALFRALGLTIESFGHREARESVPLDELLA